MQKVNYHNSSDEDLLLLWKSGSSNAFDALFRRYFQPLYQYALNNLKQPMLAEEMVMDIMLRLWKTNGDIHCHAGFKPYILRALKNAILNHFRSSVPKLVSLDEINTVEERLTYKEIARLLDISVNTVENYMSSSIAQVKEKMK